MIGRKSLLIVGAVIVWLAVVSPPASAEWFADVYAGGSKTRDQRVVISPVSASTPNQLNLDSSIVAGGRAGYWFEALPWLGLAVDGSYFKAHDDITIFTVTPLLLLRYPLFESEDVPGGQLQPYVGVGPAIFFSELDGTVGGALAGPLSDTSMQPGVDVRAGLAWQFLRHFAIFGEYRFTHADAKFSGVSAGADTTLDTKLNTHHVLLGVSYRF